MRDCDSATDKIYIFTKIIFVTYISGNKSPIENKQICFSRCDESMSVKVEFPPALPCSRIPRAARSQTLPREKEGIESCDITDVFCCIVQVETCIAWYLLKLLFFLLFVSGQECIGHSCPISANLYFLKDVWIWPDVVLARRRASNLAPPPLEFIAA